MVEPWWAGLAEISLTALATVLSAAIALMLPMLREWVASKTQLGEVMRSTVLAENMDKGAENILRAAEARLKLMIPGRDPTSAEIVQEATPALEREFKETLEHFDKSPEAVEGYLTARVEKARADVPDAVTRYREQEDMR